MTALTDSDRDLALLILFQALSDSSCDQLRTNIFQCLREQPLLFVLRAALALKRVMGGSVQLKRCRTIQTLADDFRRGPASRRHRGHGRWRAGWHWWLHRHDSYVVVHAARLPQGHAAHRDPEFQPVYADDDDGNSSGHRTGIVTRGMLPLFAIAALAMRGAHAARHPDVYRHQRGVVPADCAGVAHGLGVCAAGVVRASTVDTAVLNWHEGGMEKRDEVLR